jgi:thioesterase domain-containing protein
MLAGLPPWPQVWAYRSVVGEDGPPGSLVELATRYLRDLRRQQPQGPYHLRGWSSGGIVAFEMAAQLVAAGERVAFFPVHAVRAVPHALFVEAAQRPDGEAAPGSQHSDWSQWVDQLGREQVPGDHFSILRPPCVRRLAGGSPGHAHDRQPSCRSSTRSRPGSRGRQLTPAVPTRPPRRPSRGRPSVGG